MEKRTTCAEYGAQVTEYVADFEKRTGSEPEDSIVDMITALMHLADLQGFSAEELHRRAMMHYDAEVAREMSRCKGCGQIPEHDEEAGMFYCWTCDRELDEETEMAVDHERL